MTFATLRLSNCEKCPNLKVETIYTADSWERPDGWYCKAKDNKFIAELDWNDKRPTKVPKWCPLIEK